MHTHTINWKKYFFSFAITAIVFGSIIILSNYLGSKKLAELRDIQDQIAIDILSSETQFSLLEESSCKDIGTGTLSTELGTLEEKLYYTEKERGFDDSEVKTLKRYYFLLEIKDYLLMNKIAEKCKKLPLSIIYFYSTDGNCKDCERQGLVLTKLREIYPELRVYSFDYDTDLSAVRTLITISKIKYDLPAIYIQGQTHYGFQTIEDIEKAVPELEALRVQDSATSTSATTTNSN